jgi:hypothetical protein
MDIDKLTEQILEITNNSDYGWIDLDSSDADRIRVALTRQLTLTDVSHQRELLKAYTKWLDDKLRDSDELDELMDDYFRSL